MTYKSPTRGNAVLLDSEVLAASEKATGIDPMIAIREKYPDAELIFSSRDSVGIDPRDYLLDFARGFHDEMTYYGPTPRDYQLPIVVCHHAHENAPFFFEGEVDRLAHLKATPYISRLYKHQEDAIRAIKELDAPLVFDIESYARPSMIFSADSDDKFFLDSLMPIQPLVINPRRHKMNGKSMLRHLPQFTIYDEAHIGNELAWGLDIRYKFAREDGKTHAQICKEELRTIKKRRKAAVKQLDACGARYEAVLKENEDVR